MSRIGKSPVFIPEGVKIELNDNLISISGTKGLQSCFIHSNIKVEVKDNTIIIDRIDNTPLSKSLHGTTRQIVNNMVVGVTQGFETKLDLVGVGYRAQVQGKKLNLTLGFSHPVIYELPEGVSAETPSQTEVLLKSADKQKLGQAVAEIRAFRPPEPYKGKGVRYVGEEILRKEGKKK